jgi:hypothetical protein
MLLYESLTAYAAGMNGITSCLPFLTANLSESQPYRLQQRMYIFFQFGDLSVRPTRVVLRLRVPSCELAARNERKNPSPFREEDGRTCVRWSRFLRTNSRRASVSKGWTAFFCAQILHLWPEVLEHYANPYQAPRPLPCITRWPFFRS